MRIRPDRGLGRLQPLILCGLLGVAVVACGGSAAAPVAPTTTRTSVPADAGQPSAAAASPAISTVDVGKEAWFAGFHVTFGTATAEITPGRHGTVKLETTFENTGSEDARFDATITLVSAGETASEGFDQDIPNVPGGTTGKGLFSFAVEDTFTFDDAVLTLGQPTNQQAVIPLKGGEAVSREPVKVAATGTGKAGDLRIDLAGGELRADSPWKHGQQKKGSLVVTFDYSATFNSGFAGGFAFTGENVALKLPDGTTVGVVQDGRSQSLELIPPNATKKDLFSRFEIEDPAAGTYVFLVREGNATGEIPFTID